jgi:glycosyltransferase involved in cell wall biosynthesis
MTTYRIISELSIIHVATAARMFTQFRMPMIREQRQAYKRVVLYCPRGPGIEMLQEEGFEVQPANVTHSPSPHKLREIWELSSFLKKNKFEVLFAHQPLGALVGIPAGRLCGVPVKVYSTGGLKFNQVKNRGQRFLLRMGEEMMLRLADATFLVNKEDKGILQGTRLYSKAVYVGPRGGCGYDSGKFNEGRRLDLRVSARAEVGVNPDEFVVGFVGRLVWYKGFRELMNAAKELERQGNGKTLVFLVLGEGPEYEEIVQYSKSLGISSLFRFLGYKEKIDFYMSSFDLFVLPSYWEGLPVSLLEALAMGIPAIATDVRGSRELIKNGKTGILVPAKNAAALASAIALLMENEVLANQMAQAGALDMARNFRESVMVDKTSRVLRGLVDNLIDDR